MFQNTTVTPSQTAQRALMDGLCASSTTRQPTFLLFKVKQSAQLVFNNDPWMGK